MSGKHTLSTLLCAQNGTVEDALRSRPPWRGRPPVRLDWPTRVEVGLDAAQGLLGLHRASPPLLMGALQPSDVLLSASIDAHIAAPSPASLVHGQQVRCAAANTPTLTGVPAACCSKARQLKLVTTSRIGS